jgi:anti-anti-sigma regulatory factor
MKTRIRNLQEDVVVVDLEGYLSFEEPEDIRVRLGALKNSLTRQSTGKSPRKIIFNFEKLEFVGSSGITPFVQALRDFNGSVPVRPRYCNVRSEFRKVMKAFDETNLFEFYENEDRAKKSFDQ